MFPTPHITYREKNCSAKRRAVSPKAARTPSILAMVSGWFCCCWYFTLAAPQCFGTKQKKIRVPRTPYINDIPYLNTIPCLSHQTFPCSPQMAVVFLVIVVAFYYFTFAIRNIRGDLREGVCKCANIENVMFAMCEGQLSFFNADLVFVMRWRFINIQKCAQDNRMNWKWNGEME